MRRRAEDKRPRGRVQSFPAPVKGLVQSENIAKSAPETALILNNVFPLESRIRFRAGSADYATGLPTSAIDTLMVYEAGSVARMFGAVGTAFYDVSSAAPVGSPVQTGLTNARWESTIFATTGATFLVAVNGADELRRYDGSTWTLGSASPAITGVTTSTLSNVWSHRNRLWFAERGTSRAWYMPIDSIGGAATSFNLAGVFSLGGELVAGGTWSSETGSGIDEMNVFVSSIGQVAIYSGNNPASATDWRLVGVWRIGRPLGKRCFAKFGGDLAIITEDGIIAVSQIMRLDRAALIRDAVTKNISALWRARVRANGSTFGWSMTAWSQRAVGIVLIPDGSGNTTQAVVNLTTGAWATYSGWSPTCFAVFQNRLFFGTSVGVVREADTGGTDVGEPIQYDILLAFDDMRAPGAFKVATMTRAVFEARSPLLPAISIRADYDATTALSSPAISPADTTGRFYTGGLVHDSGNYGGAVRIIQDWQSTPGYGYALAPLVQARLQSTEASEALLSRVDVMYEVGSPA